MTLAEILFELIVTATDVESLRMSAPTYLTYDKALLHLTTARQAAEESGVMVHRLLAIAWGESRYTQGAVTPEYGGRMVSCGVMTPEPITDMRRCRQATSTLLEGYRAGARHLRVWIDDCKGKFGTEFGGYEIDRCALMGYAGGYFLMNYCARSWHKNCGGPERVLIRSWAILGDGFRPAPDDQAR